MNTNEPIHLGLNDMNRTAMTVPRYYGNKPHQQLPKQLITCRWDRQKDYIHGVIYDPNKQESYEISEYIYGKLHDDYSKAEEFLSDKTKAFRKYAMNLYALGHGELFLLDGQVDDGLLMYHQVAAIYWVEIAECWIMVDARAYRNARVKYIHETRATILYKYPSFIDSKSVEHKQHIPFLKESFFRLTVQRDTVKLNPYRGDIIRYDIYTWVKDIRKDLGSTLGSTSGGIIRRIDMGSLKLDEVFLYLISSHEGTVPVMGILTMREGKRCETITIPPSSFDRYRNVISRVAGAQCVIDINA